MFREEELTALKKKIGSRKMATLLPLLAPVAVVVISLISRANLQADIVKAMHDEATKAAISRWEWIIYITSALGVIWLVFSQGMLVTPLKKYESFLDGVLHGRLHTVTGRWAGVSGDISVVDGVRFRAVGLTVTDDKGRDYERLFYWDAEKPLPDCQKGAEVELDFHDKMVKEVRICADTAQAEPAGL